MTVTINGSTGIDKVQPGAASGQTLSVNGIAFPASQVPSADANTLDDYEEGTWTPTDASGAGLTFSASGARYVKIGKQVWFWFRAQYPTTANGSNALIGGLPFTGAGGTASYDMAGGWNTNFAQNSNTTLMGYVPNGGAHITVYNMVSNQTIALVNSSVSGINIYGCGYYTASA